MMPKSRLLLLCSLLFVQLVSICGAASAEVFKWVDADGRVQFADRPPSQGGAERVELREINTYEGVSVQRNEQAKSQPNRPRRVGDRRKVTLYSADWCGVCTRAKRFFRAQGIPFREMDVDKSRAARREWQRLNATGVPVILVGDQRMNGFSEQRFMRLYEN